LVTKLNDIDFGKFLQVCRRFSRFATNELFWMHRTFALIGHKIPKPEQTWKALYNCYARRVSLHAPPTGKRRITVPHSAEQWKNPEFTVCCWVNLDPQTSRYDVICNKSCDNWECGFGVDVSNFGAAAGEWKIQAFINKWVDFNTGQHPDMVLSTQSVPTQQWFHVAVVCSQTHLTVYLNGVQGQEVEITQPVDWSDANPFTVGYTKWHGIDFYTKGETTDYRVWSRPLTKQQIFKEITSVAPESKGLTCFLPMNIVDERRVLDLSEFRNHGTLEDSCQVTPIKCRWPPLLKITEGMERDLIDLIRDTSQELL